MKTNSFLRPSALLPGVASTLLLSALAVSAGNVTWTGDAGAGTDPRWSSPDNWDTTAFPVSADNAIFSGSTQPVNTNDLIGLSLGWLRFDQGDFTLVGNALTLAGGLTNVGGINTLTLPLTLGAAQGFESAAGGTLSLSNTLNLGASALTVTGDGDSTLAGVVSGTGSLVKNGAGILTLTTINTYSGGLTANSGTINARAANNTGSGVVGAGSLVVNSGATVNALVDNSVCGNGASVAPPRTVTLNAGGILTTGDRSGHVLPLILNGGTLSASTARNDYGNWNLDYGVSTLTNGSTSSIEGGNVTLGQTGGTVFNIGAGDTVNVSSVIAHTTSATDLGLTKSGAGLLNLSEVNTYTSPTLINAGTLALIVSGSIDRSPTITVATNATFDIAGVYISLSTNQTLAGSGKVVGTLNDNDAGAIGSVLSPGGNSAVGTLTLDNLSLSGNSLALNYNLGTTTAVGGGVNDLIVVGNLSLSSSATNTVNFTFSGTPAAGAYTLIQYTTGPAAGPVTTLAAAASRSTYTFTSDGTSIKVTVVPNPAPLVWRGDGTNNNWDLNISSNWMNGAAKDVFLTGDNATFNDTGSNTPAANLVGALAANLVTVTGSKDYTFAGSGRVSSSAKLIKTSSGTLTVLTANDNTGGGSLSGGQVNVGNGAATGNLGTGNLTNNTKVSFNQNTSSTYAGNMSGPGSVSAFIPGATLTVTGTNTFTGGLTISNGTFQIGNATAGSSVAGNITNYATLNIYRSDAFTNQNTITSAGNTYEFGNGDINVRGAGGMTVDGTAPINCLGSFSVSQSAYGKVTINSGGLISAGGFFLLGNPGSTSGEVVQNGGTVNSTNTLRIGHWGTEVSYYTLNGGIVNVPFANFAVGWDGIGLMTMTNGTVNCRGFNVDDNGATAAIGGTNSAFTMTGGQLNVGVNGIGGNTATIKLSGGTIAAVAPAGFSSGMAMILTNGSPTLDSSNSVITLSGVLSGNGGLIKQGSGYLNVNGANTFTGAVSVAQGILQGTGTIIGSATVQSGAALSAGGTLATGTLTLSNLTVNPGAGLVFDLSSTAATSDLLAVKGTLALDTATPATFNFLGGTPYTGGPYTIITNWNGRSGGLTYANATRYTPTIDFSNPNRVQITFTGTNANLVWRGDVNNLWNVNTTANWRNAGLPDKYFQSDAVIFDSTGIAAPNVTLAAALTPASVTVNATGDYKFAGAPLTGVATLTKSGSGKLTLENDYTSTGLITVNSGTLQIGNGGTVGSVTGLGNIAGATIADYGLVVFNRSDTVTYNGVINGPGSLTQAGSGKLLLTGANTFFGGATINPGTTVQIGNGPIADAGVLGNGIVNNNGALIFYRLSNGLGIANPLTGGGSLTFQGSGTAGQSYYILNATNTFTGPVTLNYARLQSGLGALSLGSPSVINVQPGSELSAIPTLYSPTYTIPLTLAGTGWQNGLGALQIEGGGTWAGPITLANNARIGVNVASTNVISGTITGPAYELETYGGNAGAVLVLSPSAPNNYAALRISIGTAGATTIAGNANAIPNNIPLFMNGGILKLNGYDKSFSSFVNLNNSSSIQNGSSTSPVLATLTTPLNAVFTYGGTFADGGAKPLNVTFNQSGAVAAITLGAYSPNWTGNLTNNGGIINFSLGTTGTGFGNNNVPNRFLVVNSGGSFTWNINNVFGNGVANNYLPTLVFNNAALTNNSYNTIGPVVLNNATLTGTRASSTYQLYQLRGPVTVVGTKPSYISGFGASPGVHLDTASVFDVADVTGNASADLTVSNPLLNRSADFGGTGALVKTGAGKMLVDATAAYTGTTTISNGVLALGVSGSIATSPSIIVNGGATLDASAAGGLTLGAQTLTGSGSVVGTVLDGATSVIAPGSSAGTLTVGGLTLSGSGGTLAIELNSTVTTVGGGVNDLIQINGALSLNDAAPTPVNFTFLNGPNAAGTYTIMKYTGALSGTAAGLKNTQGFPVTFTVGGGLVQATFTAAPAQPLVWQGDGSGNSWDLVTTSVNWSNTTTSALTNFYQLDTVRFDDSTVYTTVALAEPVQPSGITFNSVNDYTLNGAGKIVGATGITKNNINRVTLATVNEFTGPVNVSAGTLALGVNDSLPIGTTVTVASGAAFDFANFNGSTTTRGNSFVIAGAGPDGNGAMLNSVGTSIGNNANVSNLTLTADAVIGGPARWDLGSVPNSKLDGQGHNLTKSGVNNMGMRMQTLTNIASITVSNGNMWYESFDQTNAWTATTTNYIKPGAFLGNYASRTVNLPIVLDSATLRAEGANGVPTWTGPVRLQGTNLFNNATVQNLYGVISGPGAMAVDGGRSGLLITNANTYAGGTLISNAPSTTVPNAASGTAALIVANPGALGSGPLTIDGSSFSSLLTNTAFFATNILRPVEFNVTGGGIVPNAINLPGAGPITNVSLQGRDATSVFTLAGKISGGFAGLTNWLDNGAGNVGVMRWSNPANDFLAGTIQLNRGTLALTTDALGNSANSLGIYTNATLRFDGPSVNVTHGIRTGVNTQNTVVLDLFGDNNGDGVQDTVNNATISGILSGVGTIYPRGTNAVLTLSGANTCSGGFELQQPLTLQVGASANLGTAYVGIKYGSTFRYTGTGSETMTRTLWMDNNGGGTIDVPSATASLTWNPGGGGFSQSLTKTGSGALTLGALGITGGLLTANGGALTINSVISGGATQVRVNTGTLTLTAVNTYGGPTLANGGSLFVSGSLPAGNAVTVAAAATLAGNGTINGPVTVAGALQPGNNAIGKLTINSVVNLSGTTTMEINKASNTNDAVVGATTLAYGGTLNVNLLGGTLVAGDTFKLFGAWAYMGSFVSTNLPSLTTGLRWDTTGVLVDGTIKVVNAAPPALAGASLLPNGNFQLTLVGSVGQGYKILASTNAILPVASWTVLQISTLPTATYNWEDLTTASNPTRFYIISTP